ncbi:Arsenical resistance operon trans-acting repressor ArsD [Desulfosporosinus sp. I2]|uniref:arsenite efflux transporter metallochaperone ArsD n=1 Tax=Desulfosporosinus sp. I2 TaxID=1617025 RepID=UPI0005EE9A41|nr:arsenite efflux transporter metallochaperone ArsD [Desulfosporosinus sp. I2]KJR46395.1 Arsenical resistance operon trans-acting repressor ArsD [Desulfosporosinus sp. I2]
MKKIQIFESAMCCSTGLCGVGVDTELLRISTVLNSLKKNGVEVDRFNLTNAPMEFVTNKAVNDLLKTKGVDELPATVLDGEILITGRYPTNEEFVKLLDIPISFLGEQEKGFNILPKNSGCGCSDGSC